MQQGLAPAERIKWRRQMAAAAGKKKCDFAVSVHGSIWSGGRSGALYLGHPVLGRDSLEVEVVPGAERSLDESGS